jgi:hypothetical protein
MPFLLLHIVEKEVKEDRCRDRDKHAVLGAEVPISLDGRDWLSVFCLAKYISDLRYAFRTTQHENTITSKMKLLTLNFLTCARKQCKTTAKAFPLHPKDAELEQVETDMNPIFIKNMLPRLDWDAMKGLSQEVCTNIAF